MKTLTESQFKFPNQTGVYHGKVRDIFTINDAILVMVVSDRISAFDVILPKGIPYKGAILNLIAAKALADTRKICPNWLLGVPAPNVSVGYKCEPIKLEMVIRGYLTGHAWRVYKSGKRSICGVTLPEGLNENDKFPHPIITPTTKASTGHDEDISEEEILERHIVPKETYELLVKYTRELFAQGTDVAESRGLILVDTKYEFGIWNGSIMLMDEIHTPDSSRYFYLEGYSDRQAAGIEQKQLSKEFVRQWLIENHFQGRPGEAIPEMSDAWIRSITDRYIELYEQLTGEKFDREMNDLSAEETQSKIGAFLKSATY